MTSNGQMLSSLEVLARIASLAENLPGRTVSCNWHLAGFRRCKSRRRWGSDGASLESVSGFSDDPIGYRGGINLYEYCGDNPVRRIDPEGLQCVVEVEPDIEVETTEVWPGSPLPSQSCLEDPYHCRGQKPSTPEPPLPYPVPSELPLIYQLEELQDPQQQIRPRPGTQEWEDYVQSLRKKWRLKLRKETCEKTHDAYDGLSAKYAGWKHETDFKKLATMCQLLDDEVAFRRGYLSLDCDFVLDGSIRSIIGPWKKKENHQTELANKQRAAANCWERYARLCKSK